MTSEPSKRTSSRSWQTAIVLGGAVTATGIVAIVVTVSLCRGVLAEQLARAWLSQHGVAARVHIESISMSGLSAKLSLGRITDPDLSVDRVDVSYNFSANPFAPTLKSVRLVRPKLKARWNGSKLRFGALDPLMAGLSKGGPTTGPQPKVSIEDGLLSLQTPAGDLTVRGDGDLQNGMVSALHLALSPFHLVSGNFQAEGEGGPIFISCPKARLKAEITLGVIAVSLPTQRLKASRSFLVADLPAPQGASSLQGPTHLTLGLQNLDGSMGETSLQGASLSASLDGQLAATAARQQFSGDLVLKSRAQLLAQAGVAVRNAITDLNLHQVTLDRRDRVFSFRANGTADFDSPSFNSEGVIGALHMGPAHLSKISILVRDGHPTFSGSARGALVGFLRAPRAVSRRLIESAPALSSAPNYATALVSALSHVSFKAADWQARVEPGEAWFALGGPLMVVSDSGARVVLATPSSGVTLAPSKLSGAAHATIDGGGFPQVDLNVRKASMERGAVSVNVAATGAFDIPTSQQAHFAIEGRFSGAGTVFRFDLISDAALSARRLGMEPNSVQNFAALVKADGKPVVRLRPGHWAASGRFEATRGEMSNVAADLNMAEGEFDALGGATLDEAEITVDRGTIKDQSKQPRFNPLSVKGRVGLAANRWDGELQLAARAGGAFGKVSFEHDVRSGSGRSNINAQEMVFTPRGLQPGDLSPLASITKAVEGRVSFKGTLAWTKSGPLVGGGELIGSNLAFTSPVGRVVGMDSTIHFTSLVPLVSESDQLVSVRTVQTPLALNNVSARFNLNAQSLLLTRVTGDVANGRIGLDSVVVPLSANAKIDGALVLDHVNIGDFIAATSLADKIKLNAVVDGRIPFTLSPENLTIQRGHIEAVAPGRISISREALAGSAPNSSKSDPQSSFGQDIAYQAMEDLAFEQLNASLDTQGGERLAILFHIKGQHDPKTPRLATIEFGDLLRGQPLAKPISLPSGTKIDMTLDTSLNFGELVKSLRQAWSDSLTGTGIGGSGPVHPSSPTMPTK